MKNWYNEVSSCWSKWNIKTVTLFDEKLKEIMS